MVTNHTQSTSSSREPYQCFTTIPKLEISLELTACYLSAAKQIYPAQSHLALQTKAINLQTLWQDVVMQLHSIEMMHQCKFIVFICS